MSRYTNNYTVSRSFTPEAVLVYEQMVFIGPLFPLRTYFYLLFPFYELLTFSPLYEDTEQFYSPLPSLRTHFWLAVPLLRFFLPVLMFTNYTEHFLPPLPALWTLSWLAVPCLLIFNLFLCLRINFWLFQFYEPFYLHFSLVTKDTEHLVYLCPF